MSTPGHVVLYRWRVTAGREDEFVRAWSDVTESLRRRGSLGSRLHRGNDGWYYGYAQWPSAQARADAFAQPSDVADARQRMNDAIEESRPEVVLDPVADFFV